MLSEKEIKVKEILIDVAKGKIKTHHPKKIAYKELWLKIYPEKVWGQKYANEVVEWIVNISNTDVINNLPPLNSIVVRKDTGQPGEGWNEWLHENKKATRLYRTVNRAQKACWKHYAK